MPNESLWAPWRLSYIRGEATADNAAAGGDSSSGTSSAAGATAHTQRERKYLSGADSECFLCRAVAETADRENLVLLRGQHTFCILNRYPYASGHLMVAPLNHYGTLAQLDDATQLEISHMLTRCVTAMQRVMQAQGFNIGLNLGHVAGAGVPGHLHWHIVPRWSGDVNFMPVVASTHVLSQALDNLWEQLAPALAAE